MKQLTESSDVRTDGEQPTVVKWNGRLHVVDRIARRWIESGMRWRGEQDREYFRVITTTNTMIDVYRSGSEWILAHIYV